MRIWWKCPKCGDTQNVKELQGLDIVVCKECGLAVIEPEKARLKGLVYKEVV